jgi:hypothetical protein
MSSRVSNGSNCSSIFTGVKSGPSPPSEELLGYSIYVAMCRLTVVTRSCWDWIDFSSTVHSTEKSHVAAVWVTYKREALRNGAIPAVKPPYIRVQDVFIEAECISINATVDMCNKFKFRRAHTRKCSALSKRL